MAVGVVTAQVVVVRVIVVITSWITVVKAWIIAWITVVVAWIIAWITVVVAWVMAIMLGVGVVVARVGVVLVVMTLKLWGPWSGNVAIVVQRVLSAVVPPIHLPPSGLLLSLGRFCLILLIANSLLR